MIYTCSLQNKSSEAISGHIIIRTLEDLYRAIGNSDTREIYLENDFVDKFFIPKTLAVFIKEAESINRFLKIHVSEKYKTSDNKAIEKLKSLRTREDFLNYIMKDKDSIRIIRMLYEAYEADKRDILLATSKISTMHLENSDLRKKLDIAESKTNVTEELYKSVVSKLDTLVSRINYKYGKSIDTKAMDAVHIPFRKYDKILYVKEITRVTYVDTLLYYLQEILRTLYAMPVRFIVLEAPYAYSRSELYPRCKDFMKATFKDVSQDDIFMAGFQAEMVKDILKNPSNVKFLIVLDRTGWYIPYIHGDGVEHVYTVSDVEDLKINLPMKRIISYNKDTLFIPHLKEFTNMSMEEKISKYSSMEIVRALIELLERGD